MLDISYNKDMMNLYMRIYHIFFLKLFCERIKIMEEDIMSDNELLLAISDIVGKNIKVLEHRIDRVENSLNKRIDEVEASLNNKIDESI